MGPWEVTYSHGPMGGSPPYGHGPMGGSPVYGQGPIGVTYLWPWAYKDWTPLLIKAVELSFGRNRCPLGHRPHGNVMGNHPPWALFENPTRMQVSCLIGDRGTNAAAKLQRQMHLPN